MRKILTFALVLALASTPSAFANYNATPGSGLTMLDKEDTNGFHAPSNTNCDATNPDQCQGVDSSGNAQTVEKNSASISTNTAATATSTATAATNTGNTAAASGTTADAAWSGSGNSTIIAALKAIYNKLIGNLTTTDAASSATGAAPPSKAAYIGANGSGNLAGLIACDNFVAFSDSASGEKQIVALVSGKTIYICGIVAKASGTVSWNLAYGTGTNCATGTQSITDAYDEVAQSGLVDHTPFWNGMKTAASNALCINLSAAVKVAGGVYYTQF